MSKLILDEKSIAKAQDLLSEIKNGAEKAATRAINRSLTTVKKDLKKEVRENYFIKSGEIEKTLTVKRASFSDLTGTITSRSPRLALHKFLSSESSNGSIYVKIKRNEGRRKVRGNPRYKSAPFTATMSNGHRGIFQRRTENSYPIKENYSVSIAQMLGTDSVDVYIEEKAPSILEKNFEREVDKILKGF